VKRPAADDSAAVLGDDEISDIFAQFGNATRKQRSFKRVGLDDGVNVLHIGKYCFAGHNHGNSEKHNYAVRCINMRASFAIVSQRVAPNVLLFVHKRDLRLVLLFADAMDA
jgi:hypothetical protein